MSRVLSALAFAALVFLLFRLPDADPGRLAAIDAHALLGERIGPVPAEGEEDARPTLAQVVLESGMVRRIGPGELELRLSGVRFASYDPPSADLDVHGLARSAILRGLRAAAAERGESLKVPGQQFPVPDGATFLVERNGELMSMRVTSPDKELDVTVIREGYAAPTKLSLLPPLVAILLAILFRRPVLALFVGVWTATYLMRRAGEAGALEAVARGLPDVFTKLFWVQLTDPYRAQIIGFVIAMLAMVGVMTRSGGIRGLMDLVARLASNARRTQIATYLMGLVVFFDDYANCILVGTTMRPLSDRFRVAREKLAYLVDSTAAPVAGLSIFSTWIAFEVSTFSAQLPAAGLATTDGYAVFLETLPFRFYCILTLVLAATIAFSGRDFGPMLKAERRARRTGQLVREGGKPMVGEAATSLEPAPGVVPRAHRAVIPVLVFVGVTLFEIVRVGWVAMRAKDPELTLDGLWSLRGVTGLLGDGDSTRALLVGSSTALAVAVVLALAAGLRGEVPRAAWKTLRAMGIAIAILYLAWMIGASCELLGTAAYLSELLKESLAPQLLPAILFLLGALVAFSTGSSWSTMSILLPLVVGLAYNLGQQDPSIGGHLLMVMSIGAVLEGSIFGDHCSPISDTTVLSSTASASDHIDHVRTQIPYALLAMVAALVIGYLPVAFVGHHPLVSLAIAAAAVVLFVRLFGKRADAPEPGAPGHAAELPRPAEEPIG